MATPKTLYVCRPLANANDLIAWAQSQGFGKTLDGDDIHTTLAYSRTPLDWDAAGTGADALVVPGGAEGRSVEQLGDRGAIVLKFGSPDQANRWQQFRDAGASWDYEGYQPHVTITYDASGVDLAAVQPYDGPLKFGPERYAEIDDGRAERAAAMDAVLITSSRMAFDRSTVRRIDQDGRLHVDISNISKAAVNPYLGSEIPDWEELGLDPTKVYQLLRDPEELKKAAPTFNNLPLIDAYEQTGKEHIPVSALDPKKEIICGSFGTDAEFVSPYLRNSLVVWDATAIKGIQNETRKEISCAYYYRADMTPGTYQGTAYHGVMRDIRGNHGALVRAGRAGSDVVVGDSQLEKSTMSKKPLSRKAALAKGALLAHRPKLAADAKLDLNAIMAGITAANWKDKKSGILAAIKPKLAADADVGGLVALLDSLDNADDNVGLDDDQADMIDGAVDAGPIEDIISGLKGKISDEDLAAVEAKLRALKLAKAEEDPPVGDDPPATNGTPAAPATSNTDDVVSKPAMDAAIQRAVKETENRTVARMRDIAAAQEFVQPWVGKLALAQDSAEGVYRVALETLGVDIKGVHASAYRPILQAQPKPGEVQKRIAQDSAQPQGFSDRFPNASVRHV